MSKGWRSIDAQGRLKVTTDNGTVGFLSRVITVNTSVPTGTSALISQSIEVSAGVSLEITANAVLEVVGNGVPQLGYFDLGIEVPPTLISLHLVPSGVDWLVALNSTSGFASSASVHSKNAGGWLLNSFRWIIANSAGLSTFTSGTTMQASPEDDTQGGGINSATGVLVSVNGASFGWHLRVPVLQTKQVLRIVAGTFSCDGQLTISFKSGIIPSKTYLTKCQVSGSSKAEYFKIPFWGNVGDEMTVQFICQNNLGITPNITFVCATLAGS